MKPIQEILSKLETEIQPSIADNSIAPSPRRDEDLLCYPECEYCHGSGYYRLPDLPIDHPQFGKSIKCPNANRKRYEQMIRTGEVNPIYGITAEELHELSWQTIKPPSVAFGYIERLIYLYQRGWGMAALLGTPGTGKTTFLKIFVVVALSEGRDAAYANTSRVLDNIRRAYDSQNAMTELEERTSWWANLDILSLDEFDKVNNTPWAQERLFALFDARYELAINKKAITLIASNYETLDPFPPYIRSRLEDELFNGYIINLSDKDVRPRRSQMRDVSNSAPTQSNSVKPKQRKSQG
ncbi:MAG: AAA family ATPase [Candidatus Kryptoniota bacterium]